MAPLEKARFALERRRSGAGLPSLERPRLWSDASRSGVAELWSGRDRSGSEAALERPGSLRSGATLERIEIALERRLIQSGAVSPEKARSRAATAHSGAVVPLQSSRATPDQTGFF